MLCSVCSRLSTRRAVKKRMKTRQRTCAQRGLLTGLEPKACLTAYSGISIQYHARATHRADLMNLELWSESERRRQRVLYWSNAGQMAGSGYLGVQRGAGAAAAKISSHPARFPPSPRAATKDNTRQPPQVGRRRRHQLPARSGCRPPLPHVACDTLDARPPARVASRAPHCRRHTAHSCSGIANTWHPHLDSRRPPPGTRLTWR